MEPSTVSSSKIEHSHWKHVIVTASLLFMFRNRFDRSTASIHALGVNVMYKQKNDEKK